MNELTLSRDIQVESFEALLTVGMENESRALDIIPFLMMVDDLGSVNAKEVNLRFLMEQRADHVYGWRWLKVMHDYHFIEPTSQAEADYKRGNFELSSAGKEILGMGKVLIPENGMFIIHLTNDPVFPEKMLACVRVEYEEKVDDRNKNGSKSQSDRASQKINTTRLDNSMTDGWKGHIIRQPANGNRPIQLIEVLENVVPSEDKIAVALKIIFSEGGHMSVRVESGDSKEEFQGHISIDLDDVLSRISTMSGFNYDRSNSRILIDVNAINEELIDNRTVTLPATVIELDGIGKFNTNKLVGVEAYPSDIDAAIAWISMLMRKRINDYIEREEFESVLEQFAGYFEPDYPRSLILSMVPSYESELEMLRSSKAPRNPQDWFLLAPSDLSGAK